MAGALLAPNLHASLSSGTVVLNDAYAPNGGGPFQGTITSALPTGIINPNFSTFCLSIDTTFSPGNTYNFVISPTINHDSTPPLYPDGLSSVSLGAATIYNAYLNNQFSSTLVNNGAVQAAIWYYQGLLNGSYASGNLSTPETGNIYLLVNDILTAPGLASLGLTTDTDGSLFKSSGGLDDIYALDLSNSDGSFAQPQLIDPTPLGLTPVPEASTLVAGALMLLPFGVSTIRIMRKKMIA